MRHGSRVFTQMRETFRNICRDSIDTVSVPLTYLEIAMTFTIHVPIFPLRREIMLRKQSKGMAATTSSSAPRMRSRDEDGFLALEMLPMDELDSLGRSAHRRRRG